MCARLRDLDWRTLFVMLVHRHRYAHRLRVSRSGRAIRSRSIQRRAALQPMPPSISFPPRSASVLACREASFPRPRSCVRMRAAIGAASSPRHAFTSSSCSLMATTAPMIAPDPPSGFAARTPIIYLPGVERGELREGGRAGAGILRSRHNVRGGNVCGEQPQELRPRGEVPWFWGCSGGGNVAAWMDFEAIEDARFDGKRWNGLHHAQATKEEVRWRRRGCPSMMHPKRPRRQRDSQDSLQSSGVFVEHYVAGKSGRGAAT